MPFRAPWPHFPREVRRGAAAARYHGDTAALPKRQALANQIRHSQEPTTLAELDLTSRPQRMGCLMNHLWHITLNTGDARKSPRSEVTDAAVSAVLPHMHKALAGSLAEIPFVGEGCRLKATAEGAFLLGSIMVIGAPALTFGVAPESRDAAQL